METLRRLALPVTVCMFAAYPAAVAGIASVAPDSTVVAAVGTVPYDPSPVGGLLIVAPPVLPYAETMVLTKGGNTMEVGVGISYTGLRIDFNSMLNAAQCDASSLGSIFFTVDRPTPIVLRGQFTGQGALDMTQGLLFQENSQTLFEQLSFNFGAANTTLNLGTVDGPFGYVVGSLAHTLLPGRLYEIGFILQALKYPGGGGSAVGYFELVVIPAPAAVWLGVLGLAAIGRRYRHAAY